jgi:hypothetical protein
MSDDTTVLTDTTTDTTTDATTTAVADATADTTTIVGKTADTASTTDTTTATTDDWRTRLAGDDSKLLGYLGRYTSEKAFVEAAKKDREAARNAPKPLSDDPTEEELAAYRTNFDVPDKPEGYLEKLPEGLVVGEDDRPIVDEFLAAMHEKNAPGSVTAAAIDTYYKIVEKQEAAIAERVAAAKTQAEDALREEWGADYRRNVNITQSYLETLPEAVQDAITDGFDGKGTPLGSNAAIVKWLAGLALEANPVATVVPGAGSNQASAIADEMANLEKLMGDTNSDYWKGPKAAGMQKRYLQLVEAKQKLK